ncbi:hypothetical protein Brsp07_03648 [Brucella sp. NBRC 14130]|uniref:hypothetical protein n=1 Tax=Brucella sp. NBRC 14130 TaxID=3075483 RepID=UPI00309A7018
MAQDKTSNYQFALPNPVGIQIAEMQKVADSIIAIDAKLKASETALSTHRHSFADLLDKPTTLEGYGITDGMTAAEIAAAIKAAIDGVVNGSGAALDTLKELADALGNDPQFATTVSNALGVRVRVDAAQSFSLAQKAQGRGNLDALGTVDKGKANGVASLDGSGKVPVTQLPTMDYLPLVGGTLSGPLGGVTVSGSRSSFLANAEGGGYAQMWTRGAPFYSSATLSGSSYAPVIAEKYGNPGWGGIWSAGVLNYSNGAAAGFAIHHLNSSGNEHAAFEFRADGTLRMPGAVYRGGSPAAYADGQTYWMHITGNAGYAASAGNANTVGGWSQGTIADQDNWRVTDTRFAGYVEHAMERDTGWHAPSGYVFTYAYRKGGDQYYFGARQPQIYIPNAGWRALGGW